MRVSTFCLGVFALALGVNWANCSNGRAFEAGLAGWFCAAAVEFLDSEATGLIVPFNRPFILFSSVSTSCGTCHAG